MKGLNRSPQVGRGYSDVSETMDFVSALKEAVNGKRIRRLEWGDEGVYLTFAEEKLMIFQTKDKMFHPLTVSTGDVIVTDWVVVEEDRVTH